MELARRGGRFCGRSMNGYRPLVPSNHPTISLELSIQPSVNRRHSSVCRLLPRHCGQVYGSVCFTQIFTSWHLRWNIPMTSSFAPSCLGRLPSGAAGTVPCVAACKFFNMRNAMHQPSGVVKICAHLSLHQEVVFKNDMSVKQSIASC